jgi:DNA mismatch endonuclease (patch repair protein)
MHKCQGGGVTLSNNQNSGAQARSPEASSQAVRRRMQATPKSDTKPELALRSAIHRRGLRYRVNVSPIAGGRRRADLVFKASRVVVFVDGCFWHRCPVHGSNPKTNSEWWDQKLTRNQVRDRDTDRDLRRLGWKVIRVWEHEHPDVAAARIEKSIRLRAPIA